MSKKLKLTKNAHMMHINTAINSLHEAVGNKDVKTVKRYLKSVIEKYDTILADSAKLQDVLTDDTELGTELDEMYALEERVLEIRCNAMQCRGLPGTASNDTLTLINTLVEGLKGDRAKQIEDKRAKAMQRKGSDHLTPKLPDLPIEKFNGDLEKYQGFMDSYISTI